ncbi:MAG: hypothetical protein HY898_09635 [Deltaproteobacteria bacterium]|nr:hypothetical protein [Deltaproteobacteria bacterium]
MMRSATNPSSALSKATLIVGALAVALLVRCGSDDSPPPAGAGGTENAGSGCTTASQCYPALDGGVEGGQLLGAVVCMDKVPGGYCTHLCTADSDCCAVPGECLTGHPQVCSPFESSPEKYCILSCEEAQVTAAGMQDASAYCAKFANSAFGCRSSGGGSQNRKVCMP